MADTPNATIQAGAPPNSAPPASQAPPPTTQSQGIVWDTQPLQSASNAEGTPDQSGIVWDQPTSGSNQPSAPVQGGAAATMQKLSNDLDVPGNLETGALHGLASTASGLMGLSEKLANPSGDPNNERPWFKTAKDWLDQHSQNTGTDTATNLEQKAGYGGETLLEFIMGDEALKGLPLTERLEAATKALRTIEKGGPRFAQALKYGAGLMAEAAQVGARTAAVQGAQTLVRSGGNVGEAAKDAATAGIVGAPLGALGAVATDVLGGAGKAATTVQSMSDAAANAPSEQGVFNDLATKINDAKSNIDQAFDQSKAAAEGEKNTATQAVTQASEGNKEKAADLVGGKREQDAAALEDTLARTERGRQAAKAYVTTQLVNGLSALSKNASDVEDLAPQVNDAINKYEQASHTTFENGINGENGVVTELGDQKLPVAGSPIQKYAAEALSNPNPADHPMVAGMKNVAGDKLDASVKQQLENFKSGTVTTDAPQTSAGLLDSQGRPITTGGGGGKVTKPMPDLAARDLVQLRQTARKAASGYMRGDPNRRVLGGLITAIDDSLGEMAKTAGKPEVVDQYGELRQNYKAQRALLDSNTADKLKLNSPDQALDDVTKYMTSGGNPLAKLATLRQVVGDETMQNLASARVGVWRDAAQTNPTQFVKEFGKMSAPVQDAFFGPEAAQQLRDLAETYSRTSQYVDEHAKSLVQSAKEANLDSNKVAKELGGSPGSLQVGGLLGQGIKGADKAALDDITSRYNEAVKAAEDAQKAGLEPFKGGLMKDLSEGRINDALLKGRVDVQDIQNLKKGIGDQNWQGVADGVFQRAVADSSPKGRFDPQALMDWWTGIKPEVRSELFNLNDPANAAKVQDAIKSVSDSADVKRMFTRLGIAGATTGTTGAGIAVGALAGPAIFGHFGEIIGGLLGLGTGRLGTIRNVVEWVANHPNTWKALGLASRAANSPATKLAGTVARGTAGYTANALRRSLSGADLGGGTNSSYFPLAGATSYMAVAHPKGLVAPGNLPIWNRPTVQNTDGSHSTEYSTSFREDRRGNPYFGKEVLIPSVINGRFATPDGRKPPENSTAEKQMFRTAWEHYLKTGEHLGVFDNPDDADAYAGALHNRGERK